MTKRYVVGLVFAGMGLASLAIGCGADEETVQEVGALLPATQVARQIAPLSGSLTGSARPLLRWTGPGVELVQLCSDRDCRHLLSSFAATGAEGRPSRPLPPGVAYWRLLARGHHGFTATPAWELFVSGGSGHGGSAVANRGFRYDADGDGFADAGVRAQNGDAATDVLHVFSGGPHGLRQARDTMLTLDTSHFGVGAAAAGDTNGDGFGDFAVADGRGVVVYGGSPSGPGTTPLTVLPVPAGANAFSFGFELAGLGDVNGDGYGDLAVADGSQMVWVYLGGPNGLATVPAWVLDSSASQRVAHLMTACDCNGDGYGDLVTIDSGSGTDPVGFRFFRGGAGGLEDPGAGTFVERPAFPQGTAGDVDGDGVMDLVTSEGTTLVLFRGGPGFPGSPIQTIAVAALAAPLQLGDFDGDGAFDLAATTSTATSNMFFTDDRIDLYRGGPSGLGTTPVRMLQETAVLPDNQLNFGIRLGNADFDGDGREDLLVGAPPPFPTPFFDTSASVVFVFEGAAHGLVAPKPAPRLDGTPGFGDEVSAGGPQSGP
jgi:hypothetical protein